MDLVNGRIDSSPEVSAGSTAVVIAIQTVLAAAFQTITVMVNFD